MRALIKTDVLTFLYWLRRNLYLLIQAYKVTNPAYFRQLKAEFGEIPDTVERKNFYREFAGISIKLIPLSNNLTEVILNNMKLDKNFDFDHLITKLESHPLREIETSDISIPYSFDPIEWFKYREDTNDSMTLKEISEEISLSHGYIRNLHAKWKKERE